MAKYEDHQRFVLFKNSQTSNINVINPVLARKKKNAERILADAEIRRLQHDDSYQFDDIETDENDYE